MSVIEMLHQLPPGLMFGSFSRVGGTRAWIVAPANKSSPRPLPRVALGWLRGFRETGEASIVQKDALTILSWQWL
jgi:hypothetical protein